MNRNTKILLGVLGGLVACCACAALAFFVGLPLVGGLLAERMIETDPAAAAATAHEVADYELPAGYRELAVSDFFVGKFVIIGDDTAGSLSSSRRPVIMLMQISVSGSQMDPEQFRLQMQRSMNQTWQEENIRFDLAGQETVTLRGQETILYYYEGESDAGVQYSQIVSEPFEGKTGTALLFITGPTASWDQAEIDAFIESIR
jgi:hypothetical protein